MSATTDMEIAIADELDWLANNVTVGGLHFDGDLDLDEALRLYAPTLFRIRRSWRLARS